METKENNIEPAGSESRRARELLPHWRDTRREYPSGKSLHGQIGEWAARTPSAEAVVCGGERVTYRELDGRATRLALRLRGFGVGLETPVAVSMERSAEMIVGLLAVLKAGGAYVPVDPGNPAERFGLILEDTGAPVLLTQKRLASKLPVVKTRVVCIEDEELEAAGEAVGETILDSVNGGNLAYIVYTSGSTGTPKGVAVPHRAVSRLVVNTDYAQLRAGDVVAQLSNCAFDAATFEIWGTLLNGARLVIVGKETLLSAADFAGEIAREKISAMFLTTALFNHLAKENGAIFAGVKHVLFGGEACDPRAVRTVLEAGPPENLLHVYGPTETTTFATWYRVAEVPEGAATVPIGRPIANTQVYVLDAKLQPVPPGVAGEICIGGPGLARGYYHAAELTAERFVADPFAEEKGGRMYRTGDIGRWQADGNLVFIGRADGQVKIRGFRIEPGEVEAALVQHEAVRSAVVIARGENQARELVAYFIPGDGKKITPETLREWLRGKLPDHMVPAAFVPVRAFPLTPNGKTDRRALPEPPRGNPHEMIAAKTELECAIVDIWRSVLGFSEIGATDNFFDIGGDSIRLMEVHSKLCRALRRPLAVTALFQYPTVVSLARFLGSSPKQAAQVSAAAERARKQHAALARNLFKNPRT